MLRDANKRCLQVDLFGQRHSAPIILAPVVRARPEDAIDAH